MQQILNDQDIVIYINNTKKIRSLPRKGQQKLNNMTENNKDKLDAFLSIVLGAIAILAVKSIFENDNSKIISKKGRKLLTDSDKMNEFESKIKDGENTKSEDSHNEIYL